MIILLSDDFGRGTGAFDEYGKETGLRIFESKRYIILIFCLILAGFFLTSSYSKLVDMERYSVDAAYNLGILPGALVHEFGLGMAFI